MVNGNVILVIIQMKLEYFKIFFSEYSLPSLYVTAKIILKTIATKKNTTSNAR